MYFVIYKYHETLSKCVSVILWVKNVFVTQLYLWLSTFKDTSKSVNFDSTFKSHYGKVKIFMLWILDIIYSKKRKYILCVGILKIIYFMLGKVKVLQKVVSQAVQRTGKGLTGV